MGNDGEWNAILQMSGNSFVDPRPVWGMYWRCRTTLICVHQGEDRNWLLVELSRLYMDREDPFEPIAECMECEILTFLGKHEHGVEEIGVLVDESDDFIGGESQEQPHLADVLDPHPGLAESPHGGGEAAPMELIEVEEFPEEQVHLYDDFIITKKSRILYLRTACHWLGVSRARSKTRLFERVKRAHTDSLRRSAVEIANAEYEREAQVAVEIPGPREQPSARERALHNLTHIPYRDWCQFCISTRAKETTNIVWQILRQHLKETDQPYKLISISVRAKMKQKRCRRQRPSYCWSMYGLATPMWNPWRRNQRVRLEKQSLDLLAW